MLPGITILIFTLGLWLPPCPAQDNTKQAAGGDKVLAVVNGKSITESDLHTRGADQFAQLEHEFKTREHDLLESLLQDAIQDNLIEADAAARGISKEQVLADIKVPEVTDADVDKFYDANKAQIPRPKEQVAAQIRQYLQQQGQAEARQEFIDGLEAKYKVENKLEPLRTEVAASGPSVGPANAPVTIVEFSDFQCPFCGRLFPTMEQVKAKYGDKVRIVFRQYPLPMHANAEKAAEASLCANEQGKFWEMHDAMFKQQQNLAVDSLKSAAVTLGLNAEQFNSCLDSGKYAAQIQADKKDGSAAGVNGTPALFINGRFVNGAVPLEQLTKIIDDELQRKTGA